MSEFPALRESLVRAAARRRRRRLTFRAAVPAFALAVAALLLFLVPADDDPQRREEVATPAPTALEQSFGVFRRERTQADEVPPDIGGGMLEAPRWEQSRLLAKDGMYSFYAVPNTDGLCLILLMRGKNVSSVCGTVAAMAREGALPGTLAGNVNAYLFPDGSRDVSVTLSRGENRLFPAVRDNGMIVRGSPGLISWTAASGKRYIHGPRQQRYFAGPGACPRALGPLPDDAVAAASRAALLASERVFPGIRQASVTGARPATPGTPCPAAIAERAIEVELLLVPGNSKTSRDASPPQRRVLVGVVNGHLDVFYLLR